MDWDGDDDYVSLSEIVRRLRRADYQLVDIRRYRSPSGVGWHMEATVHPSPTCAEEVVALQLLLGSDLNREACNLSRAKARRVLTDPYWRERWNVLYG